MSGATAITARSRSESTIPKWLFARDASIERRKTRPPKASRTERPTRSRNNNLCEQKKSHDTYSASWESSRRRREVNVRNRKEPANDENSIYNSTQKPTTDKNKLIMTILAAERSLWRIRFMQGPCCWLWITPQSKSNRQAEYIHSPLASQECFSFSSWSFCESF